MTQRFSPSDFFEPFVDDDVLPVSRDHAAASFGQEQP